MRFTKILSVCFGLALLGSATATHHRSAVAGATQPRQSVMLADGGDPLPIPPRVADGGDPLPIPPLTADGGDPLPIPPRMDGGDPLPIPPLMADGGDPLPIPPHANAFAAL
jgi:hypothetical protein